MRFVKHKDMPFSSLQGRMKLETNGEGGDPVAKQLLPVPHPYGTQ